MNEVNDLPTYRVDIATDRAIELSEAVELLAQFDAAFAQYVKDVPDEDRPRLMIVGINVGSLQVDLAVVGNYTIVAIGAIAAGAGAAAYAINQVNEMIDAARGFLEKVKGVFDYLTGREGKADPRPPHTGALPPPVARPDRLPVAVTDETGSGALPDLNPAFTPVEMAVIKMLGTMERMVDERIAQSIAVRMTRDNEDKFVVDQEAAGEMRRLRDLRGPATAKTKRAQRRSPKKTGRAAASPVEPSGLRRRAAIINVVPVLLQIHDEVRQRADRAEALDRPALERYNARIAAGWNHDRKDPSPPPPGLQLSGTSWSFVAGQILTVVGDLRQEIDED